MKSSATVTAADTNNDPRQPNRFEKKKTIFYSRRTASHVRTQHLIRLSWFRNFLYIAGVLQPADWQTVPARQKAER
jgi:hypothetical protein